MSFKIPCGGFKLDEKSFSLDVNGVLSVSGGGSGGVTTLHINVTAVNPETMEATFTADKTPAEMQQASVNGPIWCVVTFAAGLMGEEAKSFGVPPAWEYINKVVFGSVTLPLHNKTGKNDVILAISGTCSNDEWFIDLTAFKMRD